MMSTDRVDRLVKRCNTKMLHAAKADISQFFLYFMSYKASTQINFISPHLSDLIYWKSMKFSIRRLYSRVQAHFFLKGTVLNTVALKMHHLIYFPQAPGLSNKSIVFADNMNYSLEIIWSISGSRSSNWETSQWNRFTHRYTEVIINLLSQSL